MESLKIRVRVGSHEFEAEGPRDSVEAQFHIFKELVAATPAEAKQPLKVQERHRDGIEHPPSGAGEDAEASVYEPLFRVDRAKRVVSLLYLPQGEGREFNALLLMLLGYRDLLSHENVLGGWLIYGLQQSGMTLERIDRIIDPHVNSLVLRSGVKRGTKYRLTNQGIARAKELADAQLGMLS